MSRLSKANLADAKDHAVIAEPWTYTVAGIQMEFSQSSQLNSWLELRLARDGTSVRLRFEGVQDLEIDAGFPNFNQRLQILDIGPFGWEGLHVRVQEFEPVPGIRFWARSVERIGN